MIRVYCLSKEEFPVSLMDLVRNSGELEILKEQISPDVILIYTALWNRGSLTRFRPILFAVRIRIAAPRRLFTNLAPASGVWSRSAAQSKGE